MKSFFIVCVFSLLSLVSCTQNEPKPDLSEAFALVDVWLEAQVAFDNLPGLSAGIVVDGELVWSNGYGLADVDKKVDTKATTIYSICSISKLFTSIAIMQLRDQGKLSLEGEITEYLPWFNIEQAYENDGPITIRSLLTHSAGLPRESKHPYWSEPDFEFPTSEEIKSELGNQKTIYPPSKKFQYSNLGMSLLGEVVAEVSGIPFETYVETNILQPLRLADTHPKLPEEKWGNEMATGYSSLKRNGERDIMPFFQAKGIAPAAGFASNVEDLARFAAWQMRLLEKGGEEVLKASTLREMHRVHWVNPDWKTTWGLGFSVREYKGRSMVGHGGSCPGYLTTLSIDAEKRRAFVVMINAHESPNKYASGMQNIIEKALAQDKDKKKKKTDISDYMGIYSSQPWGSESAVVLWEGKLAMVGLPSSNPAERISLYKHIKEDTFKPIRDDGSLGEEIIFERDDEGEVIRINRNNNFSVKIK